MSTPHKPKAPPKYWATVKACCKAVGIDEPTPEFVFAAPRKFRFDFVWLGSDNRGVALEVDGGIWVAGRHSRGSGLLKEHEKMNLAALQGFRVFRCTPQNVGDLALYRMIRDSL